jgi:hypothetical protein
MHFSFGHNSVHNFGFSELDAFLNAPAPPMLESEEDR